MNRDAFEQGERERRRALLAAPTIPLQHVARLTAPEPGWMVQASLGWDGDLIGFWCHRSSWAALTFRDAFSIRPNRIDAAVTKHTLRDERVLFRGSLPALSERPVAHPLPTGRLIVVGDRATWTRAEGAERNALVVGPDGVELVRSTLGDGIEHVQTTPSGRIWVGYSDQGVIGDLGWGNPDAPAALRGSGLVRFSERFQVEWEFPITVESAWPAGILDAYALNVVGEDAWAYYLPWTDEDERFLIARVQGDALSTWETSADGATVLLVSGSRVALGGGYDAERDRVVVGWLDADRLAVDAVYRLVLADGSPLPERAQLLGRGSALHVLVGLDWYRIDLDDIRGSAPSPVAR